MCGRYSITADKTSIEHHFKAHFAPNNIFHPTYNAAPSQLLPIITTDAPDTVVLARWGFVPEHWRRSALRPQNNAR
jgi:putative SOS response-associated peptidase YedK